MAPTNVLDPLGIFKPAGNPVPKNVIPPTPTSFAAKPVYPGGQASLSPFATLGAPAPVMPHQLVAQHLNQIFAANPPSFAASGALPVQPTVSNTVRQFHSY